MSLKNMSKDELELLSNKDMHGMLGYERAGDPVIDPEQGYLYRGER